MITPNANDPYGQGFLPSSSSSPPRFYVRPIVLLVLIVVIAVLLYEKLLGFPGLFFWFIGGDLMQLWFIVLVVLGFMYRGSLSRLRKRGAGKSGTPRRRYQATFSDYPAGEWSGLAQERSSGKFSQGLFQVPLVLLVVFLVYYFFIMGYTFPVGPHPSVAGDCNAGTITVQGKVGSDTVSLKAGLLTIEGFGNYDSANHVLNINGNLCGFTLEVPATTNVHLSGNDATLSVKGVTGKIELDNNAGDINIDGSSLLAGSVVNNNAGKITISNSCLMSGVQVGSNGSPIIKRQVKSCNGAGGQ